jgi:hypothetical protein
MSKKSRPIRICGDVAYVPLTQGYVSIIDAADAPLVAGRNWCVLARGGLVHALRTEYIGTKKHQLYLHRRLMGEPEGLQIDHIDGDGLNNRRYNLRVVTSAQNNRNTRRPCNNKSGFKGVSWDKGRGKFRASIRTNYKQTHLGMFTSPEEAHEAYCRASEKYHGEFGRTE